LRSGRVTPAEGKIVCRSDDFRVAKAVFREFPADSLAMLEKEYSSADAVLKGSIVQVIGAAGPDRRSEQIAIEALDDKDFCEEEYPGFEGTPLRVCDVAYNQLVLLWQVRDVLRTIGVIHGIDVRDYHIQVLKGKIGHYRRV
jgi:hypothetical protein